MRLIVQREMATVDGIVQIALQRGTTLDVGFQMGVEKSQPVASGCLGFIHGQIGLFEQHIDVGALVVEHGYADAGRTTVYEITELVGLA